jgi:putative inorganic carbon (HCO3(-)) transporter|tara:strand:- start:2737 stop:4092 length:1356 start_codon:yes stop_codon:yes gene_type:complete
LSSSDSLVRSGLSRWSAARKNQNGKESKVFVYLVCLYLITWYLQLNGRVGLLEAIRFEFILGAFLSCSAVIKVLGENSTPTPLKTPVILFLCILVFYTIFSYDRSLSWQTFYDRTFKFSMLALFFAAFIRTTWALKMATFAFLVAMLKLTQEGFLGWLTGSMVWENQGILRLHGSTGLYRHPNSFSGLAVGCLPFIYYLLPIAKWWQKAALGVLLIFCIVVIVFTGSRTGYVASLLLVTFFWWQKTASQKVKGVLVAIAIGLFALSIVPTDYIDRFESIFTLEEKEGKSSEKRILIIKDAISVFAAKPWGVGVGAFPTVRQEMFGRAQDTHNLYLELLTNLSIFGFIAFLFLVARLLSTIKSMQKHIVNCCDSSDSDIKFLLALSSAIYAFVIARLFLGMFGMDTYEIYWWFSTGVTISIYRSIYGMKRKPGGLKGGRLLMSKKAFQFNRS